MSIPFPEAEDSSAPSRCEPRLAMCGNVYPSDTPGAVLSVLEGPIAEWAERLRERGLRSGIGFGLYLAAGAAGEVARSEPKRARLNQALCRAGLELWTANAFPFGSFHGKRVKEKAFLPDWTSKKRLAYTCRVAELLHHLMMPGSRGSVSTCPLGYGPDARRDRRSVDNLRRAHDGMLTMEERTGVRLVLALEPEPDGCFERVPDLASWLAENVLADVPARERRVGICWDLCHSAVVGETGAEVLDAVRDTEVPIGKVQISAALEARGGITPEVHARLAPLAQDPYFHQVRGRFRDGRPLAVSDLSRFLASPALVEAADTLRIHCHVPVHRADYGDGLRATDWRAPLRAALSAGLRDFELETYTLPVLPSAYLEKSGVVGTMVAEMEACAVALGLRAGSPVAER